MNISALLKKFSLLALAAATIIGCSSTSQPQHLSAATQVIQTEAPLYVTNDKAVANNFKLVTGNDKSVEAAFKQYARTGKAPNIKTDGFERFAYSQMQQPVISCEPFQETGSWAIDVCGQCLADRIGPA